MLVETVEGSFFFRRFAPETTYTENTTPLTGDFAFGQLLYQPTTRYVGVGYQYCIPNAPFHRDGGPHSIISNAVLPNSMKRREAA
jgi:hypothetical protein